MESEESIPIEVGPRIDEEILSISMIRNESTDDIEEAFIEETIATLSDENIIHVEAQDEKSYVEEGLCPICLDTYGKSSVCVLLSPFVNNYMIV